MTEEESTIEDTAPLMEVLDNAELKREVLRLTDWISEIKLHYIAGIATVGEVPIDPEELKQVLTEFIILTDKALAGEEVPL